MKKYWAILAIVLLVFWFIGVFISMVGNLIHLLLILALISFLAGRR